MADQPPLGTTNPYPDVPGLRIQYIPPGVESPGVTDYTVAFYLSGYTPAPRNTYTVVKKAAPDVVAGPYEFEDAAYGPEIGTHAIAAEDGFIVTVNCWDANKGDFVTQVFEVDQFGFTEPD